MNFEDFEKRLDKELFYQAVSKQQLEEMEVLFNNLRELLSKSTSNSFYGTYIFCFSNAAKLLPNLSLSDFRRCKAEFILMTLKCLKQINRSDDTPVLHEIIEKFFIAYKKILYKKEIALLKIRGVFLKRQTVFSNFTRALFNSGTFWSNSRMTFCSAKINFCWLKCRP